VRERERERERERDRESLPSPRPRVSLHSPKPSRVLGAKVGTTLGSVATIAQMLFTFHSLSQPTTGVTDEQHKTHASQLEHTHGATFLPHSAQDVEP
jgi:hypothetical protein